MVIVMFHASTHISTEQRAERSTTVGNTETDHYILVVSVVMSKEEGSMYRK